MVIELRRPTMRSAQNGGIILHAKMVPASAIVQESSALALAAATGGEGGDLVAVENVDGKRIGILSYDYEQAALILTMTSDLPLWKAVDVEIETRDGQHVTGNHVSCQERRLVLLENTPLREKTSFRSPSKPNMRTREGKPWTARPKVGSKPCCDKRNS